MIRVLLVEDDLRLADALVGALRARQFEVSHVATGAAALQAPVPDVVLLDLGLPDRDGLRVCRDLRENPETASVGIIIITARSQERERVIGLRSGADDYVVKPVAVEELCARIEAVLRRSQPAPGRRELAAGPLEIDLGAHLVRCDGEPVELTPKEFDLLVALAREPDIAVSHDHLMLQVWNTAWPGTRRTLEVHIGTLRAKLGRPDLVETVRGVGYRLVSSAGKG